MPLRLIKKLQEQGDLKSFFYLGEFLFFLVFVLVFWVLRPKAPESQFRNRESDPNSNLDSKKNHLSLFTVEKLRANRMPHEILGIREGSSAEEIKKAYRSLMKRYHPDKVGSPGTQKWVESQKIAEAINHAKDEMLKRIHSQPKK
jgi:hypothetical protein